MILEKEEAGIFVPVIHGHLQKYGIILSTGIDSGATGNVRAVYTG